MPDPWNCTGPECHGGDFAAFDHFADVLNVQEHELPHAFAAWLGGTIEWDGGYRRIS